MTELTADDTVSGLARVIDAGLSAAGYGSVADIWHSFFPSTAPEQFSDVELAQMSKVIESALGEAAKVTWEGVFLGVTEMMQLYTNDPANHPTFPATILAEALTCAEEFRTAQALNVELFLASRALVLAALKLAWQNSQPADQPAAARNISDMAVQTLTELYQIEKSAQSSMQVHEWCNFKAYTTIGEPPISAALLPMYGAKYRDHLLELVALVKQYQPESLGEIKHPTYVIQFLPFESSSAHLIWQSNAEFAAFRVDSIGYDARNQNGWVPLGDIVTNMPPDYPTANPTWVGYIRPTYPLGCTYGEVPGGWAQVWNDSNSGESQNLSFWWAPNDSQYCILGSAVGSGGGYDAPSDARACILRSHTVRLPPPATWSMSAGGGLDDAASIRLYSHPQFGGYGIVWADASNRQPLPGDLAGLDFNLLDGSPFPP
ncbi:MAG: hypothetical protein JWR84_4253 [Caulobacter sp.]|nr:hypothetical protein [Caulobacter sp.]